MGFSLPHRPETPRPQTSTIHQRARATAEWIENQIEHHFYPGTQAKIAVIAGTGLSILEEAFTNSFKIPYQDIDGFSVGNIEGHGASLICGTFGGTHEAVLLLNGRAHYYEGNSMEDVAFPIRVLSLLGIETLIITNAAGSLNKSYNKGDIVIINDHINFAGLAGVSPLRGPVNEFGPRFLPLSDAYDLNLRCQAHKAWKNCGQNNKLEEGVYVFAAGPTYETRAEVRMLSAFGDLVGMSTVPEIVVARHCGMKVLGVSVVTNNALHDPPVLGNDPDVLKHIHNNAMQTGGVNHAEVLAATDTVAVDVKNMIVELVKLINDE